jgi:anthranilate phosphoribosyltransferase
LGVKIDLNAEQVARSIDEVGIGFMFAPLFHPAMKHAAAPRRELGIRTVFNILGPLTNPAAAAAQVIGVADLKLTGKLAEVLRMLGVKRAMVVHGSDGLDEITVTAPTYVCELKDGNIDKYIVNPEELGFKKADIASLKGGDAIMGAAIIKSILNGETGLKRDTVVINSAAALKVGGKVATLKEGVALAEQTVDSGKARAKLEQLVGFSNSF